MCDRLSFMARCIYKVCIVQRDVFNKHIQVMYCQKFLKLLELVDFDNCYMVKQFSKPT